MEKPVLQYLFTVIFSGFLTDFCHVIAQFLQMFNFINLNPVNIIHDKKPGRSKRMKDLGAGYIGDIFLIGIEQIQVCRLLNKIHLLLGGFPELIQNRIKINQSFGPCGQFQNTCCLFHQRNIIFHNLSDRRSLDLDYNLPAIFQHSRMYLGNGGGTKGYLIYVGKDILHRLF